jgi:RES domain-containing protein
VWVWRVTRRPYAANPLTGEGAARAGNRWNSKGVRIAYTSTSRALALLEMLVHVSRETVPSDAVLIPVEVPDNVIAEIVEPPKGWDEYPGCESSREVGDKWVRDLSSAALLVPSAVLRPEKNLLINPAHPDFSKVRVHAPEESALDPRLFTVAE